MRSMQQHKPGHKDRPQRWDAHSSDARQNLSRWRRIAYIVVLSLSVAGLMVYQLHQKRFAPWTGGNRLSRDPRRKQEQEQDDREWEWGAIEPSRDLRWHSCYDDTYDCARLDLPMDWIDPTEDERVILAVIRLRATETGDNYRGPVIFNPGGPGGSGVYAMKDRGAHLQSIIGRNHDLISFDPRGIGASLPRIRCWDRPEQSRLWELQDVGVVDAHPGVVYDVYARAVAFSQTCEAHMADKSNILRHVGTATHARDMLEIVNKLGYEKLKYWGFSYGTLLGGVFAAMYPDKVERLVSDGNVDYREWHHQEYVNFLRDTDKVMAAFYEFCHRAGPTGCDFYADTPELIQERYDHLLETIRQHPVIVPADGKLGATGPSMPQVITWSHVRRLTSSALYQPMALFKKFAAALATLEVGDGRLVYQMMQGQSPIPSICSTDAIQPDMPRLEDGNSEAFPAIMCSDYPVMNFTAENFAEFARGLTEISKSAGDVNALFRLACVGRKVRPKWRFDGPFEANTSFPILYVANIADNVSPLVSATNNSQGFAGSVILVQNSYGHTSLSAPSTCTANYIRNYFQHGHLPKPGTTCEPDYFPFQEVAPKSEDDDEMATALRELTSRSANWGSAPRLNI